MARTKASPLVAVETPEENRDRVAAVSIRVDGTPDQRPGYIVLDKEHNGTVHEIIKAK